MTELLVTLSVLALVLATAGPSLVPVMGSMRLSSAATEFMADMQLARATAIQRNVRVVMCKGQQACASSGGWEQGWLLFEDLDGDGQVGEGEEILHRREPLATGLRLTGNQTVSAYLGWSPLGLSKLHNGGFQAGTLTLCRPSDRTVDGLQLVINAMGRVRLQAVQLDSCAAA